MASASHYSDLVYCMSVSMYFPLLVSPLFIRLWGHVAGSRSVSEFPERGDVTSGFL